MTTYDNPADAGFYMPGEWMPHSCCWMAWPCRDGMFEDLANAKRAYSELADVIAQFEPVNMLVRPDLVSEARRQLSQKINLVEMPIDDSWTRDAGPNFLVNDRGELAGSYWRFNAWGEKFEPYDQDALMAQRVLELVGVQSYKSPLTAEGGGITVDGEGTVITTESCFLHPNRNPGWSKAQVSSELCRTLGASKIIWIPGDPEETEIDGHVDGVAAFVRPGVVLVECNAEPQDEHYKVGADNLRALENQTDAMGRVLELEVIYEAPCPLSVRDLDCRSYVNSYLANGAVIVPGYGCEADAQAVATYQRLYPEREVVQVQISDLASGGGGIHCVTQQPASSEKGKIEADVDSGPQ